MPDITDPSTPPPNPVVKKRRKLKDLVGAPPPRPSLESFLDHFFQIAGGPRKVAKMLYDEWNSAAPGSLMRTRIGETILRNLKAADSRAKPMDDLGILSDEDIERFLNEREQRLIEAEGVTDGTGRLAPAPATPGTPAPADGPAAILAALNAAVPDPGTHPS